MIFDVIGIIFAYVIPQIADVILFTPYKSFEEELPSFSLLLFVYHEFHDLVVPRINFAIGTKQVLRRVQTLLVPWNMTVHNI